MCQVHEEEIRRSLGSGSLISILDILFHFVHFLEFSFAVPAEYLVSFPLKMIAPATYLDTFSVSHLLTHPLHFCKTSETSNKVTASELLVEYDRLDYGGQLSLGKVGKDTDSIPLSQFS